MLFEGTLVLYVDNHTKQILCGQNVEFLTLTWVYIY